MERKTSDVMKQFKQAKETNERYKAQLAQLQSQLHSLEVGTQEMQARGHLSL